MTNKSDYLNAAKKTPSQRSAAEQHLVDNAYKHGMTDIKNADYESKRHARIYGD